jgi:adenine-specific DNA-methyltransferase
LNSGVADEVFRCMSGSVAVSAFELEALPLPPPNALSDIEALVGHGAPGFEIEAAIAALYN